MNKRQIVASLNSIANELDTKGLFKEANEVTEVMVRLSQISGMNETRDGHPSLNKSIFDKYPVPTPGTKGTRERSFFEKYPAPEPGTMGTNPIPDPPYDLVPDSPQDTVPDSPKPANKPNVGKKPGVPNSKPGSSDSRTPKSAEGLDRWVNKAENIYKAWGQKGANPNSSAFGLVKDIVDYMQKVKSNLPTSLHNQANAKIAKVQGLLGDIFDGNFNPSFTPITLPYGSVSGYPKKGADPFTTGPKMTEKQLNYQARNEGKSY